MSDRLLTEETMISEIAQEICGRLGAGDSTGVLNEFLAKYPRYGKCRTDLICELKWATAACAVAAYCRSCNELANPEDVAVCVESALRKVTKGRMKTRREKTDRSVSSTSEVLEYLKVLLYVLTSAGRLRGGEDHGIHTSLRSVAYLAVMSSVKGKAAMDEEFGDAVHLLDELVHPMLLTAFQKFSNPVEDRSFYASMSRHGLYAT